MQQLQHIESICHHCFQDLLLLFLFLTIMENLYMIHRDLDLFYDIYNTIGQHYQKQIHFLSSIVLTFLDIFVKENQKGLQ